MRKSRKAVTFGLVALAALSGIQFAASMGQEPSRNEPFSGEPATVQSERAPEMSEEEVLQSDAKRMATHLGITDESAILLAKLQTDLDLSAFRIEGRTLGVWIEPTDHPYVVAWYTGADEGLEAAHRAAEVVSIPVEIRTHAPYTESDGVEIAQAAVSYLGDNADLAGAGVENRDARILIHIQPQSRYAGKDAELALELESHFGAPFHVATMQERAGDQATYGGRRLQYTSNASLYCTSGVSVINGGGATGVTTSGHCQDGLTYYQDSSTTFGTTFVAESRGSLRDVQWSSVVGTEYNQVYADSGYRSITSVVNHADQLWDTVCHQGHNTGYSCGSVTTVAYSPQWSGACPASCGYTWAFVEGQFLTCGDGDSGGPGFGSMLATVSTRAVHLADVCSCRMTTWILWELPL